MKILQVSNFYVGGGTPVIMKELARALRSKGHDVYFAVGEGPFLSKVYKIHHLGKTSSLLLRRLMFFNIDPVAFFDFEKFVRKIRPEVIHCHDIGGRISLETVKVALKYNIPCVVTIHDYWPVCLNRNLIKRKGRTLSLEICCEANWHRCAHECRWEALKKVPNITWGMVQRRRLLSNKNVALVSVSNYVKKVLLRFGYQSDRVKIVHNGVDTSIFKPASYHGEKVVLFIGLPKVFPGQHTLKGVEHFVKVSREIKKCKPDIKFLHIGAEQSYVRNLIENVEYVDHNEMASYYQKASCVCIPIVSPQTSSLVALEAMASAKPVIAYAIGGITEIVKNGETGCLVRRGNIDEFSEKIQWIIDNEDVARAMELKARDRVEKFYTLERMCKKYEEIYGAI